MFNFTDIREGMKVRASDGDKLGKVVSLQDGGFVIEKGLLFPKDYFVEYASVSDIRDGEIWLATTAEQLRTSGVVSGYASRSDSLHNRSDVYARDSGERVGDVTGERMRTTTTTRTEDSEPLSASGIVPDDIDLDRTGQPIRVRDERRTADVKEERAKSDRDRAATNTIEDEERRRIPH